MFNCEKLPNKEKADDSDLTEPLGATALSECLDSEELYWQLLAEAEPLAEEETDTLFKRIASGDDQAKDLLIKPNQRLVASRAISYLNRGLDFLDLIQEGNLGLINAVNGYDLSLGYKFSGYAFICIDRQIQGAVFDSKMIRLPRKWQSTIGNIQEAWHQLSQELCREPSLEELAKELALEPELIESLLRVEKIASLDAPLFDDRDETLQSTCKDENAIDLDEVVVLSALNSQLQKIMSDVLTPKEQKIIKMRFGLETGKSHTLEEVGQEFAVTRERIRQIEAKALQKIRDMVNKKGTETPLRDFLAYK
jgi:RNA polymerase primary sigma factor